MTIQVQRNDETYRKTGLKKNTIEAEISSDCYEAYIVVKDKNTQLSAIEAALESNGVVYGIDGNAMVEAIENPGRRVMVAAGSRHTDGADGWFERKENRPATDSEQKFGITNINAGETIGIIHKRTPGSIGVDVFGRKVLPKQGAHLNIFTSPNIKRTESDAQIVLEAAADGNLKIGSASIEIVPELVIRQDVDYSDGEIEFAGSLRIVGDVKGSGNLKVKHDVFIQGSVEDAKIISGGSVTVKGSFVGRGEGLIRAKGNVEVSVVLNQMVESGGSITISKESVNAHLIAGDTINATRAVIMGGTIVAGNKIEVQTLGGEHYSTTKVRLGTTELLAEGNLAIDKEMELQKKVCENLKNEIYLLVRDRIDGNNFTSEKDAQLKISQNRIQEITGLLKSLADKKNGAAVEVSKKKSPKLVILSTVHQSVVIEINGVRLGLKQSFKSVTFEESKNEIVRTKNL
jgi:uncharacterized protein (DUF342 family)